MEGLAGFHTLKHVPLRIGGHGCPRQIGIQQPIVEAMGFEIAQPDEYSLFGKNQLSKEVSAASIVQKPLKLRVSLRARPREQAALSVHSTELFDRRSNHPQLIS